MHGCAYAVVHNLLRKSNVGNWEPGTGNRKRARPTEFSRSPRPGEVFDLATARRGDAGVGNPPRRAARARDRPGIVIRAVIRATRALNRKTSRVRALHAPCLACTRAVGVNIPLACGARTLHAILPIHPLRSLRSWRLIHGAARGIVQARNRRHAGRVKRRPRNR